MSNVIDIINGLDKGDTHMINHNILGARMLVVITISGKCVITVSTDYRGFGLPVYKDLRFGNRKSMIDFLDKNLSIFLSCTSLNDVMGKIS